MNFRKNRNRRFAGNFCLWIATLAGTTLMVARSEAAILENIGVSMASMSLGNAVVADPPTIVDAIHFNPAALTNFEGRWVSGSLAVVQADIWGEFSAPDDYSIGGFRAEDDPVAGSSTGKVNLFAYIPILDKGVTLPNPMITPTSFGISFNKPGSRWTFGTAIYPEMVGGLDRTDDKDDPSRFYVDKGALERIAYFTPSVGFQLTDTLSIGVTVPVSYQALVGETEVRVPNELLGLLGSVQKAWCPEIGENPLDAYLLGLCGGLPEGQINPFESLGRASLLLTASADVTVNLGVLWEPRDWFSLGAVYRTGSDTVLTGEYELEYAPAVPAFIEGVANSLLGTVVLSALGLPTSVPDKEAGKVRAVLPFPDRVQAGIMVKPSPRWQINVDAFWADWSAWNELTLEFDRPIEALKFARILGEDDPTKLTLPRGYESVVHFGIGLQYQWSDALTLRAGYEPRKSSIPEDKLDMMAVAPDIEMFSLGASYVTKGGLVIDVGGGYGQGEYDLPASGSSNLNTKGFSTAIYNPYAGLDVKAGIEIMYLGVTLSKQF